MKNLKFISKGMVAMMAAMLISVGGFCFAAKDAKDAKDERDANIKSGNYAHTKQELTARREMVRKQQEKRVTQNQRQAAADAYKAERLKVYNAKRAVKSSQPPVNEIK